jgi:hypothetical protein
LDFYENANTKMKEVSSLKKTWIICLLFMLVSIPLFTVQVAAADYTNGVDVSGSTATIWFKSNVSTTWVDVHYNLNSGAQQNFRMTYNGTSARYEQKVTVAAGNVISYSFTYNNGTPAYNTPVFTYTVGSTGGGGTPTAVATPTFSPAGGTYSTAQTVTIATATTGATIRYTTNGTTPTGTSPAYTGPISVTATTTVKAIATKSGMTDSGVATATYTINAGGSAGSIYSVSASSVPAPTGSGVMSVKVMNGTKGAYSDSQVYWGIIGINPANGKWSYLDLAGNLQPISAALNDAAGHVTKGGVNYANIYHKISEAPWVSLPRITSGRMFVCVGGPCYIKTFDNGFAGPDINNPNDPNRDVYFDFLEFTVDGTGYHGNTTRVDMFGLPLQHRLINKAGNYDKTVGEFEAETRSGLFTKYSNEVPAAFKSLGTVQAPYRIVAPIHGSFAAGGANANYFAGYSPYNTQDILRCDGALTNAQTCAAINRHVYTDSSWTIVGNYYKAAPANYYSKFWHDHSIDGLSYGFAYDDVNNQAAYLEIGDPKGLIIRVGW